MHIYASTGLHMLSLQLVQSCCLGLLMVPYFCNFGTSIPSYTSFRNLHLYIYGVIITSSFYCPLLPCQLHAHQYLDPIYLIFIMHWRGILARVCPVQICASCHIVIAKPCWNTIHCHSYAVICIGIYIGIVHFSWICAFPVIISLKPLDLALQNMGLFQSVSVVSCWNVYMMVAT